MIIEVKPLFFHDDISQTKKSICSQISTEFSTFTSHLQKTKKQHISSSLQVYSSLIPWHPCNPHQATPTQGTHKRTTVPRAEAVAKSCPVEFKRIALTCECRKISRVVFFGPPKKGTSLKNKKHRSPMGLDCCKSPDIKTETFAPKMNRQKSNPETFAPKIESPETKIG